MAAEPAAAPPATGPGGGAPAPLTEEDQLEVLECARYGELDDLRALLDAGADVNYRDAGGNTALHRAAGNGHADIISLLIERGAAFVANSNGNTPLHWAALNGHAAAVSALLEKFEDADVLAMNAFGKSALTDAINGGHEEIARLILSHRSADPAAAKGGAGGGDGDGGLQEEEEDDDEEDGEEDGEEGEEGDAPGAAAAEGSSGGAAAGSEPSA
jgi:hypothetical protein